MPNPFPVALSPPSSSQQQPSPPGMAHPPPTAPAQAGTAKRPFLSCLGMWTLRGGAGGVCSVIFGSREAFLASGWAGLRSPASALPQSSGTARTVHAQGSSVSTPLMPPGVTLRANTIYSDSLVRQALKPGYLKFPIASDSLFR